MNQKSIAIMLAIFLGGIGIHKFYTNRPGWGFLYLVFCWTFVPAVIAILEAISWMSYRDDRFRTEIMRQT